MNDDWFLPLWLQLGILIAIIAGVGLLVLPRIAQHMKGSGGWGALASRYPAPPGTSTPDLRRQTLKVGGVVWRNCVSVAILDDGLRLEVSAPLPFLAKPPMLVPWPEITTVETVRLFWEEAAMLSIGRPTVGTITLPAGIHRRIAPRLRIPDGVT